MSITLHSNDGTSIQIEHDICKHSEYLQYQIEDNKTEVTLADINGDILELLVKYLNEYKDKDTVMIPKELQTNDLSKELCEFDYKYISDLPMSLALYLINAAAFLKIEDLHDLACSKISSFLMGKKPDEISKHLAFEFEISKEEAKNIGINLEEYK